MLDDVGMLMLMKTSMILPALRPHENVEYSIRLNVDESVGDDDDGDDETCCWHFSIPP